jgi:hypothetical protein
MTKMATNLGDALAASEDRLAEMRIAHPLQSLDGLLSFVCGDNVTFKTELYRKLAEPDDWPKMIEEEWRTLLVSNSKMLPEFKARIEDGLDDLNYVINEPAGSNGRTFPNGWVRDRAADGSKLPDREGWRLQDFVKTNVAQKAGLQVGHILCLRLYSTSSYWFINFPLRRTKQEGYMRPRRSHAPADLAVSPLFHPLPPSPTLFHPVPPLPSFFTLLSC